MLRGAVAAAVEEERQAAAELVDATEAWCVRNDNTTGDTHGHASRALRSVAKRIRARGESPRGDAASDGREGAE
jgi:hypothetical protein